MNKEAIERLGYDPEVEDRFGNKYVQPWPLPDDDEDEAQLTAIRKGERYERKPIKTAPTTNDDPPPTELHAKIGRAFEHARAEVLRSNPKAPVVVTLAGQVGASASVLAHEIVRLQKRIAELEAAPFEYAGPVEAGRKYRKNQFVTHNGSLWHCQYETDTRPGDGPAWVLAVKRGKDGKDWNAR